MNLSGITDLRKETWSSLKKIKLRKKKMTEQEEKKLFRAMTANEFINVRDIQEQFLYTKSGHVFAYIRIQPVALELLSEREKRNKIATFSSEFSNETSPYKLFAITRPIDVTSLLYNLSVLKGECTDSYRKKLLANEISDINRFALSGEVVERQFYMALWKETKEKNVDKELAKKVADVMQRFSACGLQVEQCSESDIKKLLNLFANPAYAHMEDATVEDFIPFLNKT